jgi:uncharacterized damage-inducible protein DinB
MTFQTIRSTRPAADEAAQYYFKYINLVPDGDISQRLIVQIDELSAFLQSFSEERSQHRYAEGKWSARQVLAHINDCERVFAYRAFWFARGFDTSLPSYDQEVGMRDTAADHRSWSSHVLEFDNVRAATIDLYRNLPDNAWERRGIASDFTFSVRALAWITVGHAEHHARILRQKYLGV